MKKKAILDVKSPKCNSKAKRMYATILKTGSSEYLILDFFENKKIAYRIAISHDDFIHYDFAKERWDRKTNYQNDRRYLINYSNCDEKTEKVVRKFIKERFGITPTKYNTIHDDIWTAENNIVREKDNRSKERKIAEMEALFRKMPDEPENLQEHIDTLTKNTDIIYYKRKGRYATYHCCQCGEEFSYKFPGEYETFEESLKPKREVPKQYEYEVCPHCGHKGELLQAGRARRYVDDFALMLYQTAADGTLIVRQYQVSVIRAYGSKMNVTVFEYARSFMNLGKVRKYAHGAYSDWYPCNNTLGDNLKVRYGYGIDNIKLSNLKFFPDKMIYLLNTDSSYKKECSRFQAVEAYARCPQLETLFKLGLESLCRHILWQSGSTTLVDKKKTRAADILRIKPEDLRWLVSRTKTDEYISDARLLEIIRLARRHNIPVKKYDLLAKLCIDSYRMDNIESLLHYLSIDQLTNSALKYKQEYHTMNETINEYADYIKMRVRRGDDITNSVYLRPRSLRETYTNVREEEERKKDQNYIDKMNLKFPDIADVAKKISKKYTWKNEEYLIRPAASTEEVIMEGRILHHCVGSEHQDYLKNYNIGKRFILVLRKNNLPEIPYITIEIDENRICQWYGEHDSKPDKEVIQPLLDNYVAWLNRRRIRIKASAVDAAQPVLMEAI